MKRILVLLLLVLMPALASAAWLVIHKDQQVLGVVRPDQGQTLEHYVIGTYASTKWPAATNLVESSDSLEFIADSMLVAGADSIVFFNAGNLAAELDTVTVTSKNLARLIVGDEVLWIACDTLLMTDSTKIILP